MCVFFSTQEKRGLTNPNCRTWGLLFLKSIGNLCFFGVWTPFRAFVITPIPNFDNCCRNDEFFWFVCCCCLSYHVFNLVKYGYKRKKLINYIFFKMFLKENVQFFHASLKLYLLHQKDFAD